MTSGVRSTASRVRAAPLYPRRGWSAEDVASLHRLHDIDSLAWAEIDRQLNRAPNASKTKYFALRRGPPAPKNDDSVTTPDFALRQRALRSALMPKSLTAFICGDPLPGHSALDQKRSAGA